MRLSPAANTAVRRKWSGKYRVECWTRFCTADPTTGITGAAPMASTSYSFPTHFWVGKRVIELGCGTGIVSVALKMAGAAEVLATDYAPELLELTATNAAENGVNVQTAEMDWRCPQLASLEGPFDVVVAADVIYAESAFAPLIDTINFLIRPGGCAEGANLFMVHETHNACTHRFFEMAGNAGLAVELLGNVRTGEMRQMRRSSALMPLGQRTMRPPFP